MADGATTLEARERAAATPLDEMRLHDTELYVADTWRPYFARLRAEDPVHYTPQSEFGPYWSVTRFNDIIAVDGNHEVFSSSSELGGITLFDGFEPHERSSFIGLDPPQHDAERKVVTPRFSSAAIAAMAPLIRERAARILDELPAPGEVFDFVDKVSIELTSQMLATLFDFPFEDRRLLPRASDLILSGMEDDPQAETARQAELMGIFTRFMPIWNERAQAEPKDDLISLLAHGAATTSENPEEFFGNIILLIVAGSDTTRHSISGALLAMNENPGAWARLRAEPHLLESAVPEIIRWQTPVAHMRRTALADAEIGGKAIRKGDKVCMWYLSGNRDETVISDPDSFIVDRPRPRQHLSFGFGIHRCLGNRLAEAQLKIVWEEILKRFEFIEIAGPPRRLKSHFIRGFEAIPVRIVG